MNKIVQVNTGRATHFEHKTAGIICGGSTASSKKRIKRSTGLAPVRENITCKKCLAAYDKEYAAPVVEKTDEELTLKEYVAKHGNSFILRK